MVSGLLVLLAMCSYPSLVSETEAAVDEDPAAHTMAELVLDPLKAKSKVIRAYLPRFVTIFGPSGFKCCAPFSEVSNDLHNTAQLKDSLKDIMILY